MRIADMMMKNEKLNEKFHFDFYDERAFAVKPLSEITFSFYWIMNEIIVEYFSCYSDANDDERTGKVFGWILKRYSASCCINRQNVELNNFRCSWHVWPLFMYSYRRALGSLSLQYAILKWLHVTWWSRCSQSLFVLFPGKSFIQFL